MINYIFAITMFICGIVDLTSFFKFVETGSVGFAIGSFLAGLMSFYLMGYWIYVIRGDRCN